MCGIMGYVGNKAAAPVLIDGLKRLEYRGYDSAGMSLAGSKIETVKSVGKVRNLEQTLLQKGHFENRAGIAHTRWATHGAPTEKNAHPHLDEKGRFAVVHNGIIDNYAELRKKLVANGHTFASDTDS